MGGILVNIFVNGGNLVKKPKYGSKHAKWVPSAIHRVKFGV